MADNQCTTGTNDRERGAVAVISALLLVVLLGCAAIAVDVGMLYSERAQLQNGADAGAIAIAQDCAANGTATCQSRAASSALALAKQNNLQNLAATNTPTFAGSNSVTVVTKAMNHNGPGAATFFANVFGISTVNVGATARWVGQPLRRHRCPAVGFLRMPIRPHGRGPGPADPGRALLRQLQRIRPYPARWFRLDRLGPGSVRGNRHARPPPGFLQVRGQRTIAVFLRL